MSSLGERLRRLRKERGWNQGELGKKIGVSQNTITKIENGGQTKHLVQLAEVLGVDPVWLSSGDVANTEIGNNQQIKNSTVTFNTANHIGDNSYLPDDVVSNEQDALHKHRIAYYDVRAAAGLTGFENSDYPEIISTLYLTDEGMAQLVGKKSADGICIVNVPTDSMEPTIRKGDIVFLDTKINAYNGDGIYAFAIDGALFIKRIQKLIGGGYRLHSDNKENYDPQDITEETYQSARFIGRFIRTIHIETVNL